MPEIDVEPYRYKVVDTVERLIQSYKDADQGILAVVNDLVSDADPTMLLALLGYMTTRIVTAEDELERLQ